MTAGCQHKTTNRVITVWWPSEHDKRDFQFYGDIGLWIQKNEKLLNKTLMDKCCKLIHDEFPYLTEVEVRDYAGRMYRL